jgi:hypothetical protein
VTEYILIISIVVMWHPEEEQSKNADAPSCTSPEHSVFLSVILSGQLGLNDVTYYNEAIVHCYICWSKESV